MVDRTLKSNYYYYYYYFLVLESFWKCESKSSWFKGLLCEEHAVSFVFFFLPTRGLNSASAVYGLFWVRIVFGAAI